ncbi:hypothetical protein TorRG33x02_159840 [Trema orientale]|uniref:Uncharacterized protein n=1 Tax=Trema orientale TaxID=63057 RepID=A0A2P5ERQ0_TREOI|nr:hypothetical protein TorRG33x02_159840 [Trema orientale]
MTTGGERHWVLLSEQPNQPSKGYNSEVLARGESVVEEQKGILGTSQGSVQPTSVTEVPTASVTGEQVSIFSSSSYDSGRALIRAGSNIAIEETLVTDIQMMGTGPFGQLMTSDSSYRGKRKGAEKYSGDFPDVHIDHCYHPEEYFNEILDCIREPCSVDQYRAHPALLAPAPTMEEWRAQKGIAVDGSSRPPSKKRKAQEFVLPITHLSDMPRWTPKINLIKLAQEVVAVASNRTLRTTTDTGPSPLQPSDGLLQVEDSPFIQGSGASASKAHPSRSRLK